MSVLAPNAPAWRVAYAYDAATRLTSVTSQAGGFAYTYANPQLMLPAKLALPNGAFITNTFDSVARLLSRTLKNSQLSTLNSHLYGYNLAGQRTNQTRLNGDYMTYTYDNAGQLKSALGSETNGAARWQERLGYAYDAASNLNYRTNNALLEAFSVNSLNELTTTAPSGTLTVAGTTTSPATNVTVWGSWAWRQARRPSTPTAPGRGLTPLCPAVASPTPPRPRTATGARAPTASR